MFWPKGEIFDTVSCEILLNFTQIYTDIATSPFPFGWGEIFLFCRHVCNLSCGCLCMLCCPVSVYVYDLLYFTLILCVCTHSTSLGWHHGTASRQEGSAGDLLVAALHYIQPLMASTLILPLTGYPSPSLPVKVRSACWSLQQCAAVPESPIPRSLMPDVTKSRVQLNPSPGFFP